MTVVAETLAWCPLAHTRHKGPAHCMLALIAAFHLLPGAVQKTCAQTATGINLAQPGSLAEIPYGERTARGGVSRLDNDGRLPDATVVEMDRSAPHPAGTG